MRIEELNWSQVEALVKEEKRAVLPLGSVEQHAKLSLGVDMILAHKVSVEAAQPLKVPVYPALPFGVTPYFAEYPGTVSLRMTTYLAVVADILNSMYHSGHRKILIVNGHGGNSFIAGFVQEWLAAHEDALVRVHNWWSAPQTWKMVQETEKGSSHASWMENFPWTEVQGVTYKTEIATPPIDINLMKQLGPRSARGIIGDGNFGGVEQRPAAVMEKLWATAVNETRSMLETGWADKHLADQ